RTYRYSSPLLRCLLPLRFLLPIRQLIYELRQCALDQFAQFFRWYSRAFTSSLGGIFEAVTADDRQRQCNEQGQQLAAHRLQLRDRQREQPDEQRHQRDDDTPRFEREQQGVDDRTALRFVHAPPPVSRTDSFSNQATRSASW